MMFSRESETYFADAGAVGNRFDPLNLRGNLSDAAYQKFIKIIHQNEFRSQENPFHLFVVCSLDTNIAFIYISTPNANNLVALAYPIATPIRAALNKTKSLTNQLNLFWNKNQTPDENYLKDDDTRLFYESIMAAYIEKNAPVDISNSQNTLSKENRRENTEPEVKSLPTNPVELGSGDSIHTRILDVEEIPFQRLFDLQEDQKNSNQDLGLNNPREYKIQNSGVKPSGNQTNMHQKWHPITSLTSLARPYLPDLEQTHAAAAPVDFRTDESVLPTPISPQKQHHRLSENVSFILVPRNRSHYMLGNLSHHLRTWIPDLCKNMGWKLVNLSIRPDYLRWTLKDFPDYAIRGMFKIFREETSTKIFSNYPSLKTETNHTDFWSDSYIIDRKNHNFSTQSVNLLLTSKNDESHNQMLNQFNSEY